MVVVQVWLTTKEAAEYLGVSDKQLRRWRQTKGAGPVFVRYSARTVRYPLAGLERFRREHAAR